MQGGGCRAFVAVNLTKKFCSPNEPSTHYKSDEVKVAGGEFSVPPISKQPIIQEESLSVDTVSQSDEESDESDEEFDDEYGSSDVDKYSSGPLAHHTIKFKVIGSNKESCYQQVLRMARDSIESGSHVPVFLAPEPRNPVDSQAIAFMCKLDGKEYRIGYVVSDIVHYIHAAINGNEIVQVEFAWIKYITDWFRSGPGFFASVGVTKKGRWPYPVVKAQSTR